MKHYLIALIVSAVILACTIKISRFVDAKIDEPIGGPKTDLSFIIQLVFVVASSIGIVYNFYKLVATFIP